MLTGSATALTFTYKYGDTAGDGVDIYVLDLGIYVEHVSLSHPISLEHIANRLQE